MAANKRKSGIEWVGGLVALPASVTGEGEQPSRPGPPDDVMAELLELEGDGDELDDEARQPLEDELVRRFAASPEAKNEGPAEGGTQGAEAEPVTSLPTPQFDAEQGLIQLPGEPAHWIWAFTCSQPECACRTAIVLSAPGARETLAERGRVVADAWVSHGEYGRAAQALEGVTAFSMDLDTHEVYPPIGDRPLDVARHPALREVIGLMDDDVLDAVARNWYRAKGKEPPTEPGVDGAKIEVEGWRPGDLVIWDDARPSLRSDTYVFGERVFEAFELYCVDPDCHCCNVIVDFSPVMPRGAPHPGHVEFDGKEATVHPDHERHRERLAQLWGAYCERHPRYAERFGNRSAVMHGLGDRIIGKASLPRVGRNEPCPCGSGKKYKTCCAGRS